MRRKRASRNKRKTRNKNKKCSQDRNGLGKSPGLFYFQSMENLHKEELEEIRNWLEHGDLKRVAEKFKIDRSYATKMIKGNTRYLHMAFIAELGRIALKNKSMVMRSVEALKDFKI